jgi:hypothetical protein
MMNFLLTLFIFISVLFLYIYINNQFKKSEDLEIYEMDYQDNKNLQEVCEVRQPVLFSMYTLMPHIFEHFSYENVSSHKSFDIKLKDLNDYYHGSDKTVDPVIISLDSGLKLMENDKGKHFISENNEEFLDESGILKHLSFMDDFLKPTFNITSQYDVILGSPNSSTPFKYHTNYRKFLCVTSGKVKIKMTPWKSTKYMHEIKDFDNYDFYSPIHPTDIQSQYAKDYQKTKFLEFDVYRGHTLFIPPYWWYSIQFSDVTRDVVCSITYSTVMNVISNAPNLFIYWLQQQNINQKVSKTTDIRPLPSTPEKETVSTEEPVLPKEETIPTDEDNEKNI